MAQLSPVAGGAVWSGFVRCSGHEGRGEPARHRGGTVDHPARRDGPLRNPWAYQYDIDVAEFAEAWRRGSIVASWLVELTADALARSPDLADSAGPVSDSGKGRWTVAARRDDHGFPRDAAAGRHRRGSRSVPRVPRRG
jgi:hypothetical protein